MSNMEKIPSGIRLRTCRACGRKFEYPIKGGRATRHHCGDCVDVPAEVRKLAERLSTRVRDLEIEVKRLKEKPPGPGGLPSSAA